MEGSNRNNSRLSRRDFLGNSAAALTAFSVAPGSLLAATAATAAPAATTKPNSVFGGVHVGLITYNLRGVDNRAEGMLNFLTQAGLSETELMGTEVTSYMSGNTGGGRGGAGGGRGGAGGGGRGVAAPVAQLTEAELQAQQAQRYVQLARALDMRRMYNNAGVNIHLHKISFGQTDEAIDFNFNVAKALGCVGITLERSEEQARKLAPFAEKHKIFLAFHSHTNDYPVMDPSDPILEISPYVGFNFDVGHYFAGTHGLSPIPVIEKYHDRIISIHLKDRTADGGNLPWGQGQTPICEILRLLSKEKWPIFADIELEYQYQNSDALTEVKKCVDYVKKCLA
jgi:sugar phosphate isomerase/epimerase